MSEIASGPTGEEEASGFAEKKMKKFSIRGKQYSIVFVGEIPEDMLPLRCRDWIRSPLVQFGAADLGGSEGMPTRISMLTGLPPLIAGLKVHLLKASFAAASISSERP